MIIVFVSFTEISFLEGKCFMCYIKEVSDLFCVFLFCLMLFLTLLLSFKNKSFCKYYIKMMLFQCHVLPVNCMLLFISEMLNRSFAFDIPG